MRGRGAEVLRLWRWTRSLSFFLLAISSMASSLEAVEFDVAVIEEAGEERKRVLCRAVVSGPDGTDFDLVCDGARLRMSARFVTDPLPDIGVRVRSKLETRRLYGYSERDLPLFEEERQELTTEVRFGERMVLFPLGNEGARRMRIEIVPSTTTTSPEEGPARKPLTIDLVQPSGEIRVYARKVPHRFRVYGAVRDGEILIARGEGRVELGQSGSFELSPLRGGEKSFEVSRFEVRDGVRVDGDSAEFQFDVQTSDGEVLASRWAGIARFGSEVTYSLIGRGGRGGQKKIELTLRVEVDSTP